MQAKGRTCLACVKKALHLIFQNFHGRCEAPAPGRVALDWILSGCCRAGRAAVPLRNVRQGLIRSSGALSACPGCLG